MKNLISFLFKGDIWSLLIKWGALIIVLWALGKSFGIINSPIAIEMIPYIGGGLGLLGAGMKLGRIFEKTEKIEKDVREIKSDVGLIKIKVNSHDIKIGSLETK